MSDTVNNNDITTELNNIESARYGKDMRSASHDAIKKIDDRFPITADEIEDGAVTEAKIQNGAITADKIAANSVTSAKIASSAVTEAKIGSNAVTAAKIKDGAVTPEKLKGSYLNIDYIWYANKDAVAAASSPLKKLGGIANFKTAGNMFAVMAASSVTNDTIIMDLSASTVTPSTVVGDYELYSNGDLVVYAGSYIGVDIWKRIPMHEAKTNLDGLMSAWDKQQVNKIPNLESSISSLPKEVTFHTEEGLINWISVEGVHYVTAQIDNAANPINDNSNRNYIIYTGREYDGKAYTGNRFQLAIHLATGKTFYRVGAVSEGDTFGPKENIRDQMIAWTEVETCGHTHDNRNVLDAIDISAYERWDSAAERQHTHNNETVLDEITAEKVAEWNNAIQLSIQEETIGSDNATGLYNGTYQFKRGWVYMVNETFTFQYYRSESIDLKQGDMLIAVRNYSEGLSGTNSYQLFATPTNPSGFLIAIPTALSRN